MLKKLLLILIAALSLGYIFGLTAGDIAIIAANSDATKSLAFVALEDIPADTNITFTDNAWDATNQTWRTGEGSIVWTNTAVTTKGTVVTLTFGTTFAASLGSVTTNSSFNLSTSGDQILAYEGTTAPTSNTDSIWLFGFSFENWAYANNSNSSDYPTALAGASVAMTSSTAETDNAYFANGIDAQISVSVSGTKAALLALFTDNTKYYKNDTGPLTFPTYSITVETAGTPTIIASGTLNAFTAYTGTPSASQSYNLSGSNLTAGIAVTPPAGFAISTDDATFYTSAQTLASTFNGPVYVRLTGTTAGSFSGNITHTSAGATQVDKAVSGTVTDPVPLIHATGTLNAFAAEVGTPSAAQTYNLSGEFLTANIAVTAPAGFEISTNGTTYAGTASVASSFNGPIYVRLTGTTVGSYSGNITHTSAGAAQVDVAVSGDVTEATVATLFMQENFDYEIGTTVVSNGWSAHSGAGTASPLVDATNLVYTNYPPNAGGSARTTGVTGEDISHGFAEQTSGDIYCAVLLKITALPNTTQDYCFHLGDSAVPGGGTNFRGRLYAQRDASNNIRFGISKYSTNTTVIQFTPYSYAYDTTYMMVLKYKIVPGTANDEVYLWIDPTDTVNEPAYTLFIGTADTGADPVNIGSVAIRQSSNTPAAYYDGIRIANDWARLWDPTGMPTPTIVTTGVPDPVYNIVGNPSEEISSYNLSGVDLQGPINLAAPEHFEISTSPTTGWGSTLQVPYNFDGPIYVRLNSSVVGEHSGDVTHNSTGAAEVLVRVEGETFPADVIWNITANLTPFTHEVGTPSASQSYSLSATNATGNITLTVESPFELSTTNAEPWTASLDLAPSFNGNIYVRMNAAIAGDYTGTIVHATANATNYDLAVSGTATPPAGNYATDLFFSEYVEGTSNKKAVEIFNGTGSPVDLSNYSMKKQVNGAGPFGNELLLSGTLANNDVYVIVLSSTTGTTLVGEPYVDLATTSSVMSFNGNDCVALYHSGVQTDVIGIVDQVSPNWGTDLTMVRLSTVVSPRVDFTWDEWTVYPVDTTEYLGSHTFTPGMQMAAEATFDHAAGVYYAPFNLVLSTTTPNATIYYTLDGSIPSDTNGFNYTITGPISINATTTVNAIVYATGFAPSIVTTATYIFPVLVNNIAQLRAQAIGATIYRLTGEAVLTFQQNTTRHPKYFQDATAAILVDDPGSIITSTYNLYDGVTGLTGTLALYSGLLQFTPVVDPGSATSFGNLVLPELRTFASLTSADQSKLIKVLDVTLDTTNGNFGTAAENISATDPTATLTMRTFPSTDYSGTPIPPALTSLTCLVGQFGETMQVSPRFLADFELPGGLEVPVVTITQSAGTITLSWPAVSGATSYRVEASNDPYGTYTTLGSTSDLSYNFTPTEDMKFFRVIAIN